MVLIIGAGISGLSLAYFLKNAGVSYILLEGNEQPGGYIDSVKKKDYLLESGPNTILADSEIKNFLNELGLANEYIIPTSESKKQYILKKGKLRQLPSGPFSFLFGDFFSWKTKMKIFKERYLKSEEKENETVGEFFERRFNKEIVDYAISPFVAGTFAGDPYQLLIGKTFPFIAKMEKEKGSVIKGFLGADTNKKETIIFKNGMIKLIEALAEEVRTIEYGAKVISVERKSDLLEVNYLNGNKAKSFLVDKVVITSPAFITSGILMDSHSQIASSIAKINYAPVIKVFVGFKKSDIKNCPSGYGVLNPECERQYSLGTLWNTSVNESASLKDYYLFTVMVGGMNGIEKMDNSDDLIIKEVLAELKRVYDIKANPDFTFLHRIPNAIPQYDKNILGLEGQIEDLKKDDIYICANWYKGPSVTDCIKKAKEISKEIILN